MACRTRDAVGPLVLVVGAGREEQQYRSGPSFHYGLSHLSRSWDED